MMYRAVVTLYAMVGAFGLVVLPASAALLPDNRTYELVSPMGGQDAEAYVQTSSLAGVSEHGVPTELPFQAASDGRAVVYVGGPSAGGNGNSGQSGGNEYLATRFQTGGWSQVDIMPPGSFTAAYEAFSNDLSLGVLDAGHDESVALAPEAPGAGYNVLYSRENSNASYHPLFTTTVPSQGPEFFGLPPHRSAGEFKTASGFGEVRGAALFYAGSSGSLGQLLFEANDALTPNAPNGGPEKNNLYDSRGGRLSLVNVLPDGSTEANATFGSPRLSSEAEDPPDFSHVISTNGSRIFWTDLNTGNIYVREHDDQPQSPLGGGGCTIPADACSVQVDASVGGGGRFWTATPDGSKVFFTKGDLYEYDVESGQTLDLTEGVGVQGVIGVSNDGSYVYYVTSGTPNLYVWHEGVAKRIATLAPEDDRLSPFSAFGAGSFGDWQPGLGHRTAELTPDGRSIVFMSTQSLTGYPNGGLTEVFVYDAEAGETGEGLWCVSCDPSGAPPPLTKLNTKLLEEGEGIEGTAGYVPVSFSNTYMPRWISEDGGRVFFNSTEPLVAQDTNGRVDAYEWERGGTNGCEQIQGCIHLLSGGTSPDNSYFFDASTSGDDIFMVTRAQLVSEDRYEDFVVYDAHSGGVRPLAVPACAGTGCQGIPAAPPVFATPATVTFDGVGNFAPPPVLAKPHTKQLTRAQKLAKALKACGRGRRGVRARCVAQAKERYGAGLRTKSNAKGR